MTSIHRKGIIYRIELNSNPDIRYIGSTFNELRYRWRDHKQDYQKWLNKKHSKVAIYPYFEQYGIENFTINLIESYQVYSDNLLDKKHLSVYETLWINKLKCVNKNKPFNPFNSKSLDKIRARQYKKENREKVLETNKKFYANHKHEVQLKNKISYEKNKESRLEQANIYYEKNKEKISEKNKQERIICECGTELRKKEIARHRKSNKHTALLFQLLPFAN